MEINWFWLAVICAIGGLTITACVGTYFTYKTKKEGMKYNIDMREKEDNHNHDGA